MIDDKKREFAKVFGLFEYIKSQKHWKIKGFWSICGLEAKIREKLENYEKQAFFEQKWTHIFGVVENDNTQKTLVFRKNC